MINVTAIRATAAIPPTTGAAIQAIDGEVSLVSGLAVSGTAVPLDEVGAKVGPGRKNEGSAVVEGDCVTDASAVDKEGSTVDETPVLLPGGGVKNTTPFPAADPTVDDGRGIIDTPGSDEGCPGFAGKFGSMPPPAMAESVRRSAATALELVTMVLR